MKMNLARGGIRSPTWFDHSTQLYSTHIDRAMPIRGVIDLALVGLGLSICYGSLCNWASLGCWADPTTILIDIKYTSYKDTVEVLGSRANWA